MSLFFVWLLVQMLFFVFFLNDPATTEIYTLSLHDALPISPSPVAGRGAALATAASISAPTAGVSRREIGCRSEEHTSELQSPCNLVCRLLLEKKKFLSELIALIVICSNSRQRRYASLSLRL